MLVAEHLVASTRFGDRSLWTPEKALWMWRRLREVPGVLAAKVMPDHVHVVALPGAWEAFRRALTGFTVRFGIRFDVLPPQPSHSADIAMRTVRYVLFNAVREKLVQDPFEVPWSTLRDLVGATYPTWTSVETVARVCRMPPRHLVNALMNLADHRAPLPRPSAISVASLSAVRAASAAALRIPYAETLWRPIARRAIVQTYYEISTPTVSHLARELACSPRTIHRSRAPRSPALSAVLLCLGDPRLRRHGCGS